MHGSGIQEIRMDILIYRKCIKNPELGEFLPDEKFTYEEAIECHTNNNL